MEWLRCKLFDIAECFGKLARSIKNGWNAGYN